MLFVFILSAPLTRRKYLLPGQGSGQGHKVACLGLGPGLPGNQPAGGTLGSYLTSLNFRFPPLTKGVVLRIKYFEALGTAPSTQ